MRIATWNVNSVRLRLPHLLGYLSEVEPDILCLQEIKCMDEAFPRAEVEAAGYNVATHGQKTFNGVAILSKAPVEVSRGLPGDDGRPRAEFKRMWTRADQRRRGLATRVLAELEQRAADLALERAHLRAERGLREVEPDGRAGEVQLLGDRDEVPKLTEIHRERQFISRDAQSSAKRSCALLRHPGGSR